MKRSGDKVGFLEKSRMLMRRVAIFALAAGVAVVVYTAAEMQDQSRKKGGAEETQKTMRHRTNRGLFPYMSVSDSSESEISQEREIDAVSESFSDGSGVTDGVARSDTEDLNAEVLGVYSEGELKPALEDSELLEKLPEETYAIKTEESAESKKMGDQDSREPSLPSESISGISNISTELENQARTPVSGDGMNQNTVITSSESALSSEEDVYPLTVTPATGISVASAGKNMTGFSPVVQDYSSAHQSTGASTISAGKLGDETSEPLNLEVGNFLEVLRFDIDPEWVTHRWSQVVSGGPLNYCAYTVPLVTGTGDSDLVGALIYFFNANHEVECIRFDGYTDDLTRLAISLNYYHVVRRPTKDPNLLYYESPKWKNGRKSYMRSYNRVSKIEPDKINKRYHILLELYPPDEE